MVDAPLVVRVPVMRDLPAQVLAAVVRARGDELREHGTAHDGTGWRIRRGMNLAVVVMRAALRGFEVEGTDGDR